MAPVGQHVLRMFLMRVQRSIQRAQTGGKTGELIDSQTGGIHSSMPCEGPQVKREP